MEESILTSVKDMLGIAEDDDTFDSEITMHINTVFADLYQLGVGPSECYSISDEGDTWEDFTKEDPKLAPVKTYTKDKVKLIFDPPTSSTVIEVMQRRISETEWRLCNPVVTES